MKRVDLVRLIRRLSKEQAYEVVDEHLDNYEHEEKEAKPT
jgi:hypothetical protein